MPRFSQTLAMPCSISAGMMRPVGLAGELISSRRVRGVQARSIASGVGTKPVA